MVAQVLPEGPPPADSMSFFTAQDFFNYFTLVAVAVALTVGAFQFVKVAHATPCQRLLGLRLVQIDGRPASSAQVNARLRTAIVNLLLIMLPGPVIALLAGLSVAAVLDIPFSTADQVLMKLEIPQTIRYMIHGLSFIALLLGTWKVFVKPAIAFFERANGGLTGLDLRTRTTHVRRGGA
jgi:uncharacterized RDD family membrane protein YckC